MFSTLKQQLLQNFQQRFDLWLLKRVPSAQHVELSNRNIFIFPTYFGFAFLFIVLLLFLLGTNYQNNVIMLLSYLMASFFVTAMLTAFFNLKGIKLSSAKQFKGFCDQKVSVLVHLQSDQSKFDLQLSYPNAEITRLDLTEQKHNPKQTVYLNLTPKRRGLLTPGRVKVLSEYPFGLFQVWARLDFAHQIIVYPAPKAIAHKQLTFVQQAGQEAGANVTNVQGDEFNELTTFKDGESLARVAWKQLARGQGKYTKQYLQVLGETRYLSLEILPNVNVEQKLQYLCYLVLHYHQSDIEFGLRLPSGTIEVARGDTHKEACLTALALYPNAFGKTGVN